MSDGPAVVALGGGHGLAVVLRAVRRYAGSITAIVSVADDGGSSGRLRRELGTLPPGDLRKCLVALAENEVWAEAFELRFSSGDLDGHALGNLVMVGLAETLGSFQAGLDESGRTLGAVGRVVPATTELVVLKAEVADRAGQAPGPVEGQVAVANSHGIRRVALVPADVAATPESLDALAAADQIVLAPGSLYTSLLPVVCVREIQAALHAVPATVVQVCNLGPQVPETAGLDGTAHLAAIRDHGGRVDRFLYQRGGRLVVDDTRVRSLGAEPVAALVARDDGLAHDPEQLAKVLGALL